MGIKRTARITSNAILIANDYCPLSFRSIDSIDYKKAMLIFYEQNNLYAFKQIFMEQFEFAVKGVFLICNMYVTLDFQLLSMRCKGEKKSKVLVWKWEISFLQTTM